MNRNQFIRNSLLALCSTLLPEILRPMEGVVKEEKWMVGVDPYVSDNNPSVIMLKRRNGSIAYMVRKEDKALFDEQMNLVARYYSAQKHS